MRIQVGKVLMVGLFTGGVKIGYARVSTSDQSHDSQTAALKQTGCQLLYVEHASGKQANRPELEHALKALRKGDTLVVCRLDRLGRSLSDLILTISGIQEVGASFESLAEKIDTSSATRKLIFHVFSALAEFERNLIVERTKEWLKAASARGMKGGCKPKLSESDIKQIRALMADRTTSAREIAQRFKIRCSTLYKLTVRGR